MTTYQRSKRDAKKAAKHCRKGDELWVLVDIEKSMAPWEDPQLLQRYTVTGDHPLIGGAMIGSHSVEWLVLNEGPVYTSRPAGYRAMHEPAPQVPGPLGKNTNRRLNAREILELEQQVEQALANRHGKATARRKVKAAKGNQKKLLELVR